MDLHSYQRLAARTLIDGTDRDLTGSDLMLVWTALGLAGETGEVCEHIKKGVLHGHGVDRSHLIKELGDVLWYLAGVASVLGVSLDEVALQNIEKLERRYPNGWSEQDSKLRRD